MADLRPILRRGGVLLTHQLPASRNIPEAEFDEHSAAARRPDAAIDQHVGAK
jgi:hypothetical protein